jgi:quinol monooxygenase YgiN
MIQACLEVTLAKSRQEQFLSILRPLLEPTSFEAGCTRCAVWKSITNECKFRFLTEWESEADLNRYLESGRFREVLIATELCDEAPVIAIHTISETRGFEYVTELLDGKGKAVKPLRKPR